jgi:hypothetical protein
MVPYERQIIFERGKEFKAGDIMVRPSAFLTMPLIL